MPNRSKAGKTSRCPATTALHERFTAQLDFDYRTRRPTGIRFSEPAAHQRAACNALNRERARGLLEAARHAPPGESIPVDVWNAGFARRCIEWGVPLIPLSWLGIDRECCKTSGLLSSKGRYQISIGKSSTSFPIVLKSSLRLARVSYHSCASRSLKKVAEGANSATASSTSSNATRKNSFRVFVMLILRFANFLCKAASRAGASSL